MSLSCREGRGDSFFCCTPLFGCLLVCSPHGLFADEVKVNCGWAATDLVLQSYGAPPLVESSKVSRTQATFSLEDMRGHFVEAGFQVNTYCFRDAPQSLLKRLKDGSCRGILLARVSDETQFSTETPGHYFFVSAWSPEALQVIDPVTVESQTFKSISLADDSSEAYIQFVTRPLDKLLYAPLRWMDSIWLAILPIGASLMGIMIRNRPCAIAIAKEIPRQEEF